MTVGGDDAAAPSGGADRVAGLLDDAWRRLRDGDPDAGHHLVAAARHLPAGQRTALLRALARHHERAAVGAARHGVTASARERALAAVVAHAAARPAAGVATADVFGALDGPLPSIAALTGSGVAGGVTLAWQLVDPLNAGVGSVAVRVVKGTTTVRVTEVTGPALGTTVDGLTDQQAYDVTVAARTRTGHLGVPAQVVVVAGAVNTALKAPTGLATTPVPNGLVLSWVPPLQPTGSPALTGWQVLVSGPGVERAIPVAATMNSADITGLQGGSAYDVAVQGRYAGGVVGPVASLLRQTAGLVTGTLFTPQLPDLASAALATADPALRDELASAVTALGEADRLARKFTYPYLAERARVAAGDALRYDRMIGDVTALAAGRAETAELLTNEAVIAAIASIQNDAQHVASLLGAPLVDDAVSELADAVTTVVTLTTIVRWLTETSALTFWRGLVEALVKDVVSFDTSFGHVGDFIEAQYAGTLGAVLKDVAADVDTWMATLAQPLETATAALVGEASTAVGAVFTAFDLPLTMSEGPGGGLVPNLDPLAADTASLQAAVATVVATLRDQIEAALAAIAEGEAAARVRAVVLAYVVAPIAAALVVALVGGPIAGAVLAGLLTTTLEELVHLIAGWVTGPVQAQIDAATARVLAAERSISHAFGAVTAGLSGGAGPLRLVAGELRELAAFLPRAFVDDVAGELARARDAALTSARTHALAAERAAGRAHATAFDVVRASYAHPLTPAPQLPDGTDPNYLAAARLVADLDELDRQVSTVRDGKEVAFGYRISLAGLADRVAGGGGDAPLDGTLLGTVLANGRAIVDLTSPDFFDRTTPGVYRQLLARLDARAVLRDDVVASRLPGGVPVSVTHAGPSVVRVLANNNPLAPPTGLPEGYPDGVAFAAMTLYDAGSATAAPFPPNSVQGMVWTAITGANDPTPLTWTSTLRKCRAYLPESITAAASPTEVWARSAAASVADAAHPASAAVEDDPAAYYSSGLAKSDPAYDATFTATFGDGGTGLCAVRLVAAPPGGFLAAYTLSYAPSAAAVTAAEWLPLTDVAIVADGADKVAVFGAATVHALRLQVTGLGPLTAGGYGFALGKLIGYRSESFDTAIAVDTYTARTNQANHSAALLAAPTATSYYSSEPSYATPVDEWVQLTLRPGAPAPARLRLVPRPGVTGPRTGMPASVTLTFVLDSQQVASFSFDVGGAAGPQDLYFAPQRCDTITITATGVPIPDQSGYFAVQLNAIELFAHHLPGVDESFETRLVQHAVQVALTTFQPSGAVSPGVAAAQVGHWLATTLAPTLELVHARDRARRLWSVAKWSGATLTTDPSPATAALGFATLAPSEPPELAVFADAVTADLPAGHLAPGEGRGVRARYLVEVAADAVPSLADIVLDVAVRGVASTDLAASVRAASQRSDELAGELSDKGASLILHWAGGGPRVAAGGVAAYQVSLRGERDRILRAALATLEMAQKQPDPSKLTSATIDGVLVDPAKDTVLVRGAPLAAFGTRDGARLAYPDVVTVSFAPDGNATTLPSEFGSIVLTPSLLGIDTAQLASGKLIALSVCVVPMTASVDSVTYTPTVGSLLQPYVDGWTSAQPSSRLLLLGAEPDKPATLAELVKAESAAKLTLSFGTAIANGAIYDVVVSVVTSLPATSLPVT